MRRKVVALVLAVVPPLAVLWAFPPTPPHLSDPSELTPARAEDAPDRPELDAACGPAVARLDALVGAVRRENVGAKLLARGGEAALAALCAELNGLDDAGVIARVEALER